MNALRPQFHVESVDKSEPLSRKLFLVVCANTEGHKQPLVMRHDAVFPLILDFLRGYQPGDRDHPTSPTLSELSVQARHNRICLRLRYPNGAMWPLDLSRMEAQNLRDQLDWAIEEVLAGGGRKWPDSESLDDLDSDEDGR